MSIAIPGRSRHANSAPADRRRHAGSARIRQTTTTATSTHTRQTTAQHFEKANVTHDGHLTLEQAQSGYKSIAGHFAAIDQDKKGYITVDDINAYNKTQRALHHK